MNPPNSPDLNPDDCKIWKTMQQKSEEIPWCQRPIVKYRGCCSMSAAKTAELIEMPFWLRTQVVLRNHVLHGGPDPPMRRGNFKGGKRVARCEV